MENFVSNNEYRKTLHNYTWFLTGKIQEYFVFCLSSSSLLQGQRTVSSPCIAFACPFPDILPNIIPETVQKASISLVGLCVEHRALLAGREVKDGKLTPREPCISQETELECSDKVVQHIIIRYPGKCVSASRVNHLSKFRRFGGKIKVLMIFTTMEHNNLCEIYHAKNKVSVSTLKRYSFLFFKKKAIAL